MNILVIGPGAIGSLWAIKLQQDGHQVAVFGRQTDSEYQCQFDESCYTFNNRQADDVTHADLILVTVKAWQVASALDSLPQPINPDTIIMLMHNGMGSLDTIGSLLQTNPVLLATTTHGAFKPSSSQLIHTGQGETLIGAANAQGGRCQFLRDVFDHALPAVHWHPQIEHALWRKLAVNCVINPLTAIHQCPNGELARPEYQAIITRLIAEVSTVMTAESIPVNLEQLTAHIYQVIHATSKNQSSMHQDVYYRRKTEIDFITGYLIRSATKHGIAVPENDTLYQHIKTLEQQWESLNEL
ncbi:2-dehydropantoate 2-reductase [Vibrio ruber DSM 16370]|uniref:2-dehydropantoate 2-reductase n=1 Tax=Vibrio ruber (strain DSM 16370 / JCM 11486 / BCRC 17186 / CECT 7878 / LMG 23124 / VR1) TaxID=1123498 RepID=A0A1R4LHS7_VIBR1|nr:2-dehydropantoate 2-reductase [Vibrio ruber]SJN56131.1 2-dehydropantoate 2-reductase [Vibrio ruber DSM 16370]